MICIAVPIDTVKADARFYASLTDPSVRVLKLIRGSILFWMLPTLFRMLNTALSGEAMGSISREDAKELCEVCSRLHSFINQKAKEYDRMHWAKRAVLRRWMTRMIHQNELLGDIVETLVWACDDQLHGYLTEAIEGIEAAHSGAIINPLRRHRPSLRGTSILAQC